MKKKILAGVFTLVMAVSLAGCGGGAGANDAGAGKPTAADLEKMAANDSDDEIVAVVSASEDPLCSFWVNDGFDGVEKKDISQVELFPGMLTYGDLASATDIISKSTLVQVKNYASNVVFESENPSDVLNYEDDLGGSLSDDPDKIYLQAGGKQEITCKYGSDGTISLLVCNNTEDKLTLKDVIANNDFKFDCTNTSLINDGTTSEIMDALVASLGAPEKILIKDKDVEKFSTPQQSGYNAISCFLCYKVGDVNIYIKYYEKLQGKDTVTSSVSVVIDDCFTDGLLVNGDDYAKDYNDYMEL